MPSQTLIFNSSNYESSSGDFVCRFNTPQNIGNKSELAISTVSMYNQWANVSVNATITLSIPTGNSGYLTYNYTLPPGYYSISTFNTALQQLMYSDKLYFIRNGNTTYFVTLGETLSKTTIVTIASNFASPPGGADWTKANVNATTKRYASITWNQEVADIFRFSSTIGGGEGSDNLKVVLSGLPQMQDIVQTIIITSNMTLQENATYPRSICGVVQASGVDYGSLIQHTPFRLQWMPIIPGIYTEIRLSFYSQDLTRLVFIDPNVNIQVCMREIK